MLGNFPNCLNGFTLLAANDGQPYHVDTGGGTSYGIVRANWSRWIKRPATLADMQAITQDAAAPLYQAWFWQTIDGDALPDGVDLMVFDFGVTSGETTSAKLLQQVVREDQDGWIGPDTLAAVARHDPDILVGMLAWRQEEYYRACVEFPTDGKGWLARLDRRVTAALAMIRATAAPPTA